MKQGNSNNNNHHPVKEREPVTFGELTRIFVDRRDVKFWLSEGVQHENLYWVRAMISEEVEPPPQSNRPVKAPQSEAEQMRFAQAREQVYGFLGRAFEYPDDSFLSDIGSVEYVEGLASELLQLADNDESREGLAVWKSLLENNKNLVEEYGLSPLREAYTTMIYDTNLPCIPPYQSVYCNERHVMGKKAAAASDFYREAGLGIDGNEMPDHIALECEFVGVLAGRELAARQAGQGEEVRQIQETQQRFMQEHVLSWGGKFCADLKTLAQVDFYKALALMGAGLFNDELIRINNHSN